MADRHIPLICCIACGAVRRADVQWCLTPRCPQRLGNPVMAIHVDPDPMADLAVYVDCGVAVEPNNPGRGLQSAGGGTWPMGHGTGDAPRREPSGTGG